uniref:Secreted protein n=1 Tax=Loa loa TaxID=7209 RepID=A0A1I7VNG9_LOALO
MDCCGAIAILVIIVVPLVTRDNRPNTESAESATQRLQQQQHCHGNSNDMLTYAALRTRARTPHSTASQLSSPASAAAVALRAAQHEKRPLHPRRPTRA